MVFTAWQPHCQLPGSQVSQQASNHAITNFIAEYGSGGSLSTDSFPNSSLALKSSPNPQNLRKQTEFEHKSSPNLPEIIYCEQVAAVSLIESGMHELTTKKPATQVQIAANRMICWHPHSLLFGTVICSDLRLICTSQITATQILPTFKKHCKTRANQCKSLQITPPKNHRENDAELQPDCVLNLVSKLGRRKAQFFGS